MVSKRKLPGMRVCFNSEEAAGAARLTSKLPSRLRLAGGALALNSCCESSTSPSLFGHTLGRLTDAHKRVQPLCFRGCVWCVKKTTKKTNKNILSGVLARDK